MPVSGLRITLVDDETIAQRALTALGDDDRVEIGVRNAAHVAAVVDTVDRDEDKHVWRWINELPGVRHVDVVFVSFDESPSSQQEVRPCKPTVASS